VRDEIVDFMKKWAEKTEIPITRLVRTAELGLSKCVLSASVRDRFLGTRVVCGHGIECRDTIDTDENQRTTSL
jgi:hypothetical protein